MAAVMVTITNNFKVKSAKTINKLHRFWVFRNFRHEEGYHKSEVKEKFRHSKTSNYNYNYHNGCY